jgi:hypothetical protein
VNCQRCCTQGDALRRTDLQFSDVNSGAKRKLERQGIPIHHPADLQQHIRVTTNNVRRLEHDRERCCRTQTPYKSLDILTCSGRVHIPHREARR